MEREKHGPPAVFGDNGVFAMSGVLRQLADDYDAAVSSLVGENAALRAAALGSATAAAMSVAADPVGGPKSRPRASSPCSGSSSAAELADVLCASESLRPPRVCRPEAVHAMLPIREGDCGLSVMTPPSPDVDWSKQMTPICTSPRDPSSSSVLVRMAEKRSSERQLAKELDQSEQPKGLVKFSQEGAASLARGFLQRGWTSASENAAILNPGSSKNKDPPLLWGEAVLAHPHSQFLVSIAILLNAAHTAIQADQRERAEEVPGFFAADVLLSCFFALEISFRMLVYKRLFFCGSFSFVGSNIADTVIAAVAVATTTASMLDLPTSSTEALTTARMLRFLKVARTIRIFKIIRELAMLMDGIVNSMRLLIWACIFMLMIIFVVGIFTTFVFADLIDDETVDEETRLVVDDLFGTTLRSMFTLYQIQTGDSWASAIARPIIAHQPTSVILFTLYFAFINICVLNVVVAIIVEQVMKSTVTENEDEKMRKVQDEEDRALADIIDIFNIISQDDNFITRDEWATAMDQEATRKSFAKLNISPSSAEVIFDILDIDSSGEIDREECIRGLQIGMKEIRMIDISGVQLDMWRFQTVVNTQLASLKRNLQRIQDAGSRQISHTPFQSSSFSPDTIVVDDDTETLKL